MTLKQAQGEEVVHEVPKDFERNTMFVNHMRHFLARLSGLKDAAVSFQESIHVQQIALAAHRSSENRTFIKPASL